MLMLRDEKWARNTRNDTQGDVHQGRRNNNWFRARDEWAKCGTRRAAAAARAIGLVNLTEMQMPLSIKHQQQEK